jgi:hypothetical protein
MRRNKLKTMLIRFKASKEDTRSLEEDLGRDRTFPGKLKPVNRSYSLRGTAKGKTKTGEPTTESKDRECSDNHQSEG